MHQASANPQPFTTTALIGDWKISSIQISPAQNDTIDGLALAKTLGNDGYDLSGSEGQTVTGTKAYVRYDVLGQGNQLVLR